MPRNLRRWALNGVAGVTCSFLICFSNPDMTSVVELYGLPHSEITEPQSLEIRSSIRGKIGCLIPRALHRHRCHESIPFVRPAAIVSLDTRLKAITIRKKQTFSVIKRSSSFIGFHIRFISSLHRLGCARIHSQCVYFTDDERILFESHICCFFVKCKQ